jgi:hypothetical protein
MNSRIVVARVAMAGPFKGQLFCKLPAPTNKFVHLASSRTGHRRALFKVHEREKAFEH